MNIPRTYESDELPEKLTISTKHSKTFFSTILLNAVHYSSLQFIWSCLNSDKSIVKTIPKSAKCSSVSNFGDNYRYLSYKYKIGNHVWDSPLCKLHKCFDSYMSHSIINFTPNFKLILRRNIIIQIYNFHICVIITVKLIDYLTKYPEILSTTCCFNSYR